MAIKVMAATTPEELDAVFKLRHQVFIEEGTYFAPREDKRLVDRFDAFNTSVNFMAVVDDVLVGVIRLTLNSSVGIPADAYYNFHQHLPENARVISAGQLCIQAHYRGNLPLLNSLMTMAFYWAISKQATHIVAPFNPPLKTVMQRCGFSPVSEIIAVHGVKILPMVGDLAQVRDTFVTFAKKQNIVFFIENFYRAYFSAGETIVLQDELGDEAFFIVEGRVKVTLGDIHQPELQKVIGHIEKGQLFGEIALLCSSRRVANVIAEQDTQVMVLGRDIFLEQIKKEPEKLQFILELLGSRFLDIVKHVK